MTHKKTDPPKLKALRTADGEVDVAKVARAGLTNFARILEENIRSDSRMPPRQRERILALTADESGAAALFVAYQLESEGGEFAKLAKAYVEGYLKGTWGVDIF